MTGKGIFDMVVRKICGNKRSFQTVIKLMTDTVAMEGFAMGNIIL